MNIEQIIRSVTAVPLPDSNRVFDNMWYLEELNYSSSEWKEFVDFTMNYLSRYPSITYFGMSKAAADLIAAKHRAAGLKVTIQSKVVYLNSGATNVHEIRIKK